jgi:hypothetical protein
LEWQTNLSAAVGLSVHRIVVPASWPSLPDATNTATPAETSADTALAVLLPLHGNEAGFAYCPPSPRLMLTTRMSSAT